MLFRELLVIELAYRREHQERPTPGEYTARFPDLAAVIAELFDQTSAVTPKSDSHSNGIRFKAGFMIAGRYRIVSRRLGPGRDGRSVSRSKMMHFIRRSRLQSFSRPNAQPIRRGWTG